MRDNKVKIYAIGISLIFHTIFFLCAWSLKISATSNSIKRDVGLFRVKVAKKKPQLAKQRKKPPKPEKSLKFKSPAYMQQAKSFVQNEGIAIKKEKLKLPDQIFTASAPKRKNDNVYDIKEEAGSKTISNKKNSRETKKEIIKLAILKTEASLARPKDVREELNMDADFIDRMPGFTPKLTKETFDNNTQIGNEIYSQKDVPVIKRKKTMVDLKEDLSWKMETYQDPNDGQKYFKISIQGGKDSRKFPAIPKEILFLVDCSISVEDKRLDEFKEGLRYSLTHLRKGELFNIVAFKENIFKFKETSVEPTKENIKEALIFVSKLKAGEKTDVYEALYKSVLNREARIPSYIILLSDGRPTKGVTNPLEVINKISELNKGRIAIFAFSGGTRVNRYLLDFISFKNRGWAEYSYRTHYISDNLSRMYDKIQDPIILNLRYFTSGVQNGETFPKFLPDFFRNAEFTLYGKYKEEKKFVVQLIGDIHGESREFVIESGMEMSEAGDEKIAKNWAFNKIYYLIGRLAYAQNNKAILDQINALSEQFDLKTPYLNDILK